MNVTLRQLRAFYEVADTRSFTAAARKMHLTQSAVSMLVRQLETAFGMDLFHRVQRSVQLTEAGQQMLPVTERILEDMRQVHEGAVDLKALRRGKLRLAVPQILACTWLPTVMSKFRGRYPDVALHVVDTTGDRIIETVLRDEAELGIGPKRPVPNGVEAVFLWEEPIQIVCPADTRHVKKRLRWSDFGDKDWILYSDDFSYYLERTVWTNIRHRLPRTTNVRYLSTALAFVGNGMGVTAAPRYASRFSKQFGVKFLSMSNPSIKREFYLYTREGHKLSPAASAFRETIAQPGRDAK